MAQHRAGDPTDVVGARIGAYLIDAIVMLVVVGPLVAVLFFSALTTAPAGTVTCPSAQRSQQGGPVAGGPRFCLKSGDEVRYVPVEDEGSLNLQLYAVSGLVSLLYNVLLQGATGATLGKMMCGLRVVRADGHNAGVLRCLGRTLLLPVDTFCCGVVGLVTMNQTRWHRRIGDLVAGTMVIRKSDQAALILIRSGAAIPDRATLAAAAWQPPSGAPGAGAPPAGNAPPTFGGPLPGAGQADADGPTWDPDRNAYIQYDRQLSAWVQWSDLMEAWRPIDR